MTSAYCNMQPNTACLVQRQTIMMSLASKCKLMIRCASDTQVTQPFTTSLCLANFPFPALAHYRAKVCEKRKQQETPSPPALPSLPHQRILSS